MNRPHMLILAASLALVERFLRRACAPAAAVLEASNPFAKAEHAAVPLPGLRQDQGRAFPARLRRRHARAPARDRRASPTTAKAPTFENTIVAMERSGQLLTRVATTFSNLQGANTNDKLDAIDREMSPKLAAHNDAIFLNDEAVPARQDAVRQARQAGPGRRSRRFLLERYNKDFVRAGAKLSAADKEKLKALNGQIAVAADQLHPERAEGNQRLGAGGRHPRRTGRHVGRRDRRRRRRSQEARPGRQVRGRADQHHRPGAAGGADQPRACANACMAASMARGSRGGEFDNRDERGASWPSCAPNAPRCSATRTTPPIRWKTRPPRTPPPSTSCWPNWPSRPSPTRARKRPRSRR